MDSAMLAPCCSRQLSGIALPTKIQQAHGRLGPRGQDECQRRRQPPASAVAASSCPRHPSTTSGLPRAPVGGRVAAVSLRRAVSAGTAPEAQPLLLPTGLAPGSVALIYLENNGWLAEVDGVRLLIDPVLEGPLDFGMPWLYSAYKYKLPNLTVRDVLSEPDCLLITQSLDDHCHVKTMRQLASLRPDIPIIATPNAQPFLSTLFQNVTYLEPGQSTQAKGSSREGGASASRAAVTVVATAGPVLGPPWQRPENGYIIRSTIPGGLSVYLEPHCGFDEEALKKQDKVDVVITPVVKQELPAFTLVSGQADAVRLAKALRARYVVPMDNGHMDASGPLAVLVSSQGTLQSFEALLGAEMPGTSVKEPTPGEPIVISPQ